MSGTGEESTTAGPGNGPSTTPEPPTPQPGTGATTLPPPTAPPSPAQTLPPSLYSSAGAPSSNWAPSTKRPPPRVLGKRFLPTVAAGAVLADLALRRPPWNNIAGSLAIIVLAAALVGSGRLRSRSSKAAVGLAAILGFFLWFRTDPALVTFNIFGALTLGWIGVVHSQGTSIWDSGPIRLSVRAAKTVAICFESMIDTVSEALSRKDKLQESRTPGGDLTGGLVRGGIIALPILLVLGLLLASADAVFASFFDIGIGVSIPSLIGHVLLLGIGGFGTIVLLRLAGRDLNLANENPGRFKLGRIETLVVLIGLDLLFAGFAAAQVVALTGGGSQVLEGAGLTFKEYAREGFFQLLWVAAITLVILVSLDALSRHLGNDRRAVIWSSLVAVALTLMIVVVAFGRLWLYVADDGLTPLRFYSSVFSVWIGVVFLLLAARVWGVRAGQGWLSGAIGLSGVIFLIGLNIANPEAVIMRDNLNRDHIPILFHMEKMTADGNVVLADGLDRLSPELREDVLTKFCDSQEYRVTAPTALSMNLSERRLDERVNSFCG